MATSTNVVAAVTRLCTAALTKGHPQYGAVLTPAQWGTLAGYPGPKASGLRGRIARNGGNGCGRSGRYGATNAAGMLALLGVGAKVAAAQAAGKPVQPHSKRQAQLLAQAKGGTHAAAAAQRQAQLKAQRAQRVAQAKAQPPVAPAQPSAQPQGQPQGS